MSAKDMTGLRIGQSTVIKHARNRIGTRTEHIVFHVATKQLLRQRRREWQGWIVRLWHNGCVMAK